MRHIFIPTFCFSGAAIKGTMRDVVLSAIAAPTTTTLTNLVAEYAKTAASEEWMELFDVLIGSLIVLLQRVHVVHVVIEEAIKSVNVHEAKESGPGSSPVIIAEVQLQRLLVKQQQHEIPKF